MAKKSGKKEVCTPVKGIEYYLLKISRFCAWTLIVLILLYFVSGYGMTRTGLMYRLTFGLMDRGVALWIHDVLLTIPMAIAFLLHTLISVRSALIRWNVKNKFVLNWLMIGIGVVLFGAVLRIYF